MVLSRRSPNIQAKSTAAQKIAAAGGDAQAQMDVMNSDNPILKANNSIPGVTAAYEYGQQAKAINDYNNSLTAGGGGKIFGAGQSGAFNRDDETFRKRKKRKSARQAQSRGTDALRIPNIANVAPVSAGGGLNP